MPFAATYKGRSIWDCWTPDSDIEVSQLYVWEEAAIARGFRTVEEFYSLPADTQSWIVAYHLTKNKIEAILAYEATQKAKEKASK